MLVSKLNVSILGCALNLSFLFRTPFSRLHSRVLSMLALICILLAELLKVRKADVTICYRQRCVPEPCSWSVLTLLSLLVDIAGTLASPHGRSLGAVDGTWMHIGGPRIWCGYGT